MFMLARIMDWMSSQDRPPLLDLSYLLQARNARAANRESREDVSVEKTAELSFVQSSRPMHVYATMPCSNIKARCDTQLVMTRCCCVPKVQQQQQQQQQQQPAASPPPEELLKLLRHEAALSVVNLCRRQQQQQQLYTSLRTLPALLLQNYRKTHFAPADFKQQPYYWTGVRWCNTRASCFKKV
jgi:hypothetical protein